MAVDVHVIGGFLGTGKTTALLRQLRARRGVEKVAVVINDFGTASIDAELVGDEGNTVAEIEGACICCTAPAGFSAAVGQLVDEVRPDRIFVEPTGLARPADLIDTLRRAPYADRIRIAPLVVLVDPSTLDVDAAQRIALVRDQAEAADVLVANRVDLASDEDLRAFAAWADGLWPGPMRVLQTTHGELPDDVWTWPKQRGGQVRFAHDRGADRAVGHGVVAGSWVWPSDTVFHRLRLVDALARLAAGEAGAALARLKGLFRTEEGVTLVEVAGGRVTDRPTSYRRDSRVDVLFHGEDADAVRVAEAWLGAAVMSEDERQAIASGVEVVRPDGSRRVFDRDEIMALPGGIDDIRPLVPKRRGSAARLMAVLEEAGVPSDAELVVVAADGYATEPVAVADLSTALLVHSVDGGALPATGGGPFRLLVPGDAGPAGPCSNVKGVVRLAARRG